MKKASRSIAVLLVSATSAWAEGQAPQQSVLGSFVPMIVIFAIFYLLLIRPQQKKMKEHQQLLNALKRDDRVITSGGLYATITSIKGDIVEARIADEVKVQIARSAISTVLPAGGAVVTPEIIK